jgi:hypothetical protein
MRSNGVLDREPQRASAHAVIVVGPEGRRRLQDGHFTSRSTRITPDPAIQAEIDD